MCDRRRHLNRGVVIESAIIFMVVIFLFCSIITTGVMTMRANDGQSTRNENRNFSVDQIGAAFVDMLKGDNAQPDTLPEQTVSYGYTLISPTDITDGTYLIFYNDYLVVPQNAGKAERNGLTVTAVPTVGDLIRETTDYAACAWEVKKVEGGFLLGRDEQWLCFDQLHPNIENSYDLFFTNEESANVLTLDDKGCIRGSLAESHVWFNYCSALNLIQGYVDTPAVFHFFRRGEVAPETVVPPSDPSEGNEPEENDPDMNGPDANDSIETEAPVEPLRPSTCYGYDKITDTTLLKDGQYLFTVTDDGVNPIQPDLIVIPAIAAEDDSEEAPGLRLEPAAIPQTTYVRDEGNRLAINGCAWQLTVAEDEDAGSYRLGDGRRYLCLTTDTTADETRCLFSLVEKETASLFTVSPAGVLSTLVDDKTVALAADFEAMTIVATEEGTPFHLYRFGAIDGEVPTVPDDSGLLTPEADKGYGYRSLDDIGEVVGGHYLFICNRSGNGLYTDPASDLSDLFVLPREKNLEYDIAAEGYRGMYTESTDVAGAADLRGDYSDKEWTLTPCGRGFLISCGDQFLTIGNPHDNGTYNLTFSHDNAATVFYPVIGHGRNGFTFCSAQGIYLYYDAAHNAFCGNRCRDDGTSPALFYLYRYTDLVREGLMTRKGDWLLLNGIDFGVRIDECIAEDGTGARCTLRVASWEELGDDGVLNGAPALIVTVELSENEKRILNWSSTETEDDVPLTENSFNNYDTRCFVQNFTYRLPFADRNYKRWYKDDSAAARQWENDDDWRR